MGICIGTSMMYSKGHGESDGVKPVQLSNYHNDDRVPREVTLVICH